MNNTELPIGITSGDIAGIGPEIILRSLQKIQTKILLIGPKNIFLEAEKKIGINLPECDFADTGSIDAKFLFLKKNLPEIGKSSHDAVVLGAQLALSKKISVLVTAPISKFAWQLAGFSDPGHTELIGKIAQKKPVMGFIGRETEGAVLRLALVTIHDPISKLHDLITAKSIEETVRIARDFLVSRVKISNPKIAVAGFNPHSGEGGKIGNEEIETIIPEITKYKSEGINIDGPIPADALFSHRIRRRYDLLIAMYHDQGLTAFKALTSGTGVNVTMGLPFIRTSPDHGTAFEIAGKGIADPSSMISAIKLALGLKNAE
ncbi:TPA: 4-hydroxythreonine-4-phosphate dehydrogenase PdxA [bacterium]|nr:MAG: 4-hydroxythreonine-4-phosphate dehydrogenase PdxA [Candidatus Hydrogenedentes bacterium CG1_02_42_14]HBW47670.1 4-hydroxythreonine-4-phosphate dehydrogenase PdxA [bacterium]